MAKVEDMKNWYFLFVNMSGYYEFDLEVTDFIKAFDTVDEAMDYYDEHYKYLSPLALVAECNSNGIKVVCRHPVCLSANWKQIRLGWIEVPVKCK